jgi:dipeptidase D
VSCAGGARVYSELDLERKEVSGVKCRIDVKGLLGGHSGEMIKCGRGNANIIAARALLTAISETDINLISLDGGVADNAIPSTASSTFVIPKDKAEAVKESIDRTLEELRAELENKDDGVDISFEYEEGSSAFVAFTAEDTKRVLKLICVYPDGVQAMSATVEGLVETSLNLGIIKTEGGRITIEQSVRSSVESSKRVLIDKLTNIGEVFGASVTVSGRYPGWKYNTHSELRDHMVSVYRQMYGRDPKVEAIHAGLECGLLGGKYPDMEMISFGPTLNSPHSPDERANIESSKKFFDYLVAALAAMPKEK